MAFEWLRGGNDHQLARTTYAGRPSATETANAKDRAKTRARREKSAQKSRRAGQAWEDADRARFSGR
ncbi:hypothetical protein ACGFR8_07765 [Streptomyces brevispora]|uniref:hypothetical protein n=1 Tax=Streptomyces brevispora TaxID=887462 RepID=UPI003715720E